ncbi:unnamed protein product [Pleuronectes platessa]|uniref:Uncharacterized protein n=1 Tax=Pleuronectes platessa TaxID=8262 RepID=A0A9N7UUV4_PLEPL|nr:unnamed protein product [Pleuronectes platessa]
MERTWEWRHGWVITTRHSHPRLANVYPLCHLEATQPQAITDRERAYSRGTEVKAGVPTPDSSNPGPTAYVSITSSSKTCTFVSIRCSPKQARLPLSGAASSRCLLPQSLHAEIVDTKDEKASAGTPEPEEPSEDKQTAEAAISPRPPRPPPAPAGDCQTGLTPNLNTSGAVRTAAALQPEARSYDSVPRAALRGPSLSLHTMSLSLRRFCCTGPIGQPAVSVLSTTTTETRGTSDVEVQGSAAASTCWQEARKRCISVKGPLQWLPRDRGGLVRIRVEYMLDNPLHPYGHFEKISAATRAGLDRGQPGNVLHLPGFTRGVAEATAPRVCSPLKWFTWFHLVHLVHLSSFSIPWPYHPAGSSLPRVCPSPGWLGHLVPSTVSPCSSTWFHLVVLT